MIYIGIDPGSQGCISAFYGDTDRVPVSKMMPIGDDGNVDGNAVAQILTDLITADENDSFNIQIMIEDVHAIHGTSAGSTFSFGYNVGVLMGAIQSLELPYKLVQPKAWQKEMWDRDDIVMKRSKSGKRIVKDTKETSKNAAARLFPKADLRKSKRARVAHDGVCDSILIAEYCRKIFR